MGDGLASQALEQQATDGQNIRGEQGGQVEGQDSVESGRRADVDQREQHTDSKGDNDGVQWNGGFGVDLEITLAQLTLMMAFTYVANGGGEGNTVVSGERPCLTTGGGHAGNDTSCQREKDEHGHGNRRSFAARCVVEDSQERPSVERIRNLCHVSPSKDQRDDHEEAKESVDVCRVHDRSGNRSCRVFSFFCHVHLAVESKQTQRQGKNSNHEGDTIGSVSAVVGELEESVMCIVPWRQRPEDNDHDEQASKMYKGQEAFDQRQAPCNENVNEDTEGDHCNGEQGGVPAFPYIVRVFESDESLNGAGYNRSDCSNGRLPAGESKPANNV